MAYLLLKAMISGLIIAAVSEIAKRSPTLGALVVSLPLVSLLAMIWLWRDTHDPERLAAHAQATFWYVLPSLPLFLLLPALLRRGMRSGRRSESAARQPLRSIFFLQQSAAASGFVFDRCHR